jgi:ribosomal protein S18 acetylase RimI-like enzyme
MNIRAAVESDARGVARVHVETWQAAYRGVVPDAYLDSLSIDKRERVWRESIRAGVPELWVAEIQSEIKGWVAFGASRDADATAAVGELEAIYVALDCWRAGVGRALWSVARRRLIERGFSSATLWVLAENARAIGFYAEADFHPNPVSQKEVSLGGKALREVRYETFFG